MPGKDRSTETAKAPEAKATPMPAAATPTKKGAPATGRAASVLVEDISIDGMCGVY